MDGEQAARVALVRRVGTALVALAALAGAGVTRAESTHDREMRQLQDQRDKALAAAAEPINRQYLASMEALLKRATQSSDLDAAMRIRAEIQRVKGSAAVPESANSVLAELQDGVWTLGPFQDRLVFKANGDLISNGSPRGTWAIKGDKLQCTIFVAKKPWVFDLPIVDGKLTGTDGGRTKLTLTRPK